MSENNEVARKIRLLFAKAANNPYPEEAEACMLKAQEIMAKHNLEMKDVALDEQLHKDISRFDATDLTKIPWWYWKLAHIISDNFRCYHYRGRMRRSSKVVFFGERTDVEIAISVFKFAIETIERYSLSFIQKDSYRHYTRKERNSFRNDYILGFLRGMEGKFNEQKRKNQEWALVLVKDADVVKAFDNLGLKTGRSVNVTCFGSLSARAAGYAQGKQFQPIRGSITGN